MILYYNIMIEWYNEYNNDIKYKIQLIQIKFVIKKVWYFNDRSFVIIIVKNIHLPYRIYTIDKKYLLICASTVGLFVFLI